MTAATAKRQHPRTADSALMLSVAIFAPDRTSVLGLGALLHNEPRLILSGTHTVDYAKIESAVARTHPDVVVLDAPLSRLQPVLDCCQQIKKQSPATEVVIFTNINEAGVVERAVAAGAMSVVLRTGEPRELVQAILFAGRSQPYVCSALREAPVTPELSARQDKILSLLAEGLDTRDIAAELSLSPETVKSHVKVILQKLGASGRTHAVAIGLRRGLID